MEKIKKITFDDFIAKVETYISDKSQLELIEKAYNYAADLHEGTYRMTGEAYIEHPLHVAYILTDIKADYETICAGLLHDVLEDTSVTKEEMEEEFGKIITSLVDGVTKINKLNFDSAETSAQIATQRKILVGLCNDVRVIFIKLADRLHNIRTLWVHNEQTQKEKAKETLDILIPIAHRLGMNLWKSELEDLCLRYSKPDVYFGIVEQLNQTKSERDLVVEEMKTRVSELLNSNNIKHEIKGRAKSIYSIYKKLDKGKKFSDIYDLLALRVFVNTEQECYQALGVIHSKYRPLPKRFKDYVAMPKTNMYQSLHTTVFGFDGYLFEIQIRTYEMDEVAERGIASHWSYKENGGSNKLSAQNNMESKLQFFRSIMELNNEESNDEAFVKSVTEDVFKDTIYVFTPNGDVIELPSGANPIDFAYRVHSKVGDQMVGAIVNGNIVPLDYELQNNDIVKINTNKNSAGPSREWMTMAKTAGARNKIKAFFNKIDKEEYQKRGEEVLLKELRKRKVVFNEFLSDENIEKILNEYKYKNIEELYINLGSNRLAVGSVINLIIVDEESKEEAILRKKQVKNVDLSELKDDILVEGIDRVKVNVAACCKPIPGDSIVGYITKGNGITVHRAMCPNVKEVEDRTIDVHWNDVTEKKYPSTLLIRTQKVDNMLLDIISKTSNDNILVQSVNTFMHHDDVTYDLTILVKNKDDLDKFVREIESISQVYEVDRVVQ